MRLFAIRIGLVLDVAVQRPHDADPREHGGAAQRRDQDQRFHRSLPFPRLMLGHRKLRDVVAGVLERDELPTAGKRDWIVEQAFPAAFSHRWSVAVVSNPTACARPDRSGDTSQRSKSAVQAS
jgi:hypothetical protein